MGMHKPLSLFGYLILCISVFTVFFGAICVAVDQDPFVLIPKAKDTNYGQKVDNLTNLDQGGKAFWDNYNNTADGFFKKQDSSPKLGCDLGSMLASGVVTRDTILCFLIRVVKFVANMALVVGSAMIIYAGYLYVITAVTGGSVDNTSKANEAIKNAMIGIVIVIFSYAIQRIVTQAFLT